MIIIGIILLFYSILKISIGILAMAPESAWKNKISEIPGFKLLLTKDTTISGKMLDIALLLFGILTFFHALTFIGLCNYVSMSLTIVFELLLGVYLVGFYYLVLFTDAPIQKDMRYADHYLLPGLLSGIMFIVVGGVSVMLKYKVNNYLYVITLSTLFIVIIDVAYQLLKPTNFYDLAMIPVNNLA